MIREQRLERQRAIFKKRGDKFISKTSLCIVGISGNGTPFTLFAAYAGFKTFYLIDPDRLEASNLNRFLTGGYKDIGKLKVEVTKKRVKTIDPSIRIIAIPTDVREEKGERAIYKADVVISTVDNDETRIWLQKMCIKLKKPLLDLGSGAVERSGKIAMLGSRVSLYTPGEACLFCQTLEEVAMPQSPISFVTPNAVAAAVGLELLLSWLTGYGERANFALYDSLSHRLIAMKITPREDCPYCGVHNNK